MFSTHSLISLDRALGKDARKATPQQQDHGSRLRRAVGRCCDRQVVCLHCGDAVGHGDAVGATQMVGDSVGACVGALVGTGVGASVGVSVGSGVGGTDGRGLGAGVSHTKTLVGYIDGPGVGSSVVGLLVGTGAGSCVGCGLGRLVGSGMGCSVG